MTTITLTTVILNAADNPSDYASFNLMASLSRNASQPGRTSTQAGGRIRVIRRAGQPRGWALSLPQCDRAQLDWLEAHLGQTLCARDDRGHKFFAVYLATGIDEHAYDLGADTSLDLTEITFSESV